MGISLTLIKMAFIANYDETLQSEITYGSFEGAAASATEFMNTLNALEMHAASLGKLVPHLTVRTVCRDKRPKLFTMSGLMSVVSLNSAL